MRNWRPVAVGGSTVALDPSRHLPLGSGRPAAPGATTITGMSKTCTDPNHAPCRLAPLETFSDELAENGMAVRVQPHQEPKCGRESTTVSAVFASRCCGYREPPTAAELYDAMRRSSPTDRDRTVLTAWVIEATERDWLLAWTEQAYSWRMLARAIAICGCPCRERIRHLNMFAREPTLAPRDSLPVD